MKQIIITLLSQKNIDINSNNIEFLYQAGINNVVRNLEYYYDKPYSCESVIKELFERGVKDNLSRVK